MKWVSNLPPQSAVPFPIICEEPSFKTLFRFFRPSDVGTVAAVGFGFPTALLVWERYSPSINPRILPRTMLIQVPFFLSCGVIVALQNSVFRFWGWRENSREVKLWEQEQPLRENQPQRTWSDTDW